MGGNAQLSFDIGIMLSDGIDTAEGFLGNLVYIKAMDKILQNSMFSGCQCFNFGSKIHKKLRKFRRHFVFRLCISGGRFDR